MRFHYCYLLFLKVTDFLIFKTIIIFLFYIDQLINRASPKYQCIICSVPVSPTTLLYTGMLAFGTRILNLSKSMHTLYEVQ